VRSLVLVLLSDVGREIDPAEWKVWAGPSIRSKHFQPLTKALLCTQYIGLVAGTIGMHQHVGSPRTTGYLRISEELRRSVGLRKFSYAEYPRQRIIGLKQVGDS
jgi:hypothetical protein